jgi:D-alanine-D-alanine ligase-like ATP-grasp enzyme
VSRCGFRFDDRIEGTGLDCLEVHTQPGMTRHHWRQNPQAFAGNI